MKNIINLITIITLSITFANAQIDKTLENTWKVPANKKVSLNLKFGTDIKVTAYNGNEVKLKSYLTASSEELLKAHRIKASEGSDLVDVVADYDFGDKDQRKDQCWNCNDWNPNCFCLKVRYEVMVPADVALNLETISGDIEIRGLTGEIRAKSISGYVDVALKPSAKADLNFKSITGEIYTDFDGIKLDGKSTSYSKRLSSSLNGGGPRVALETISGDIYFRKGK